MSVIAVLLWASHHALWTPHHAFRTPCPADLRTRQELRAGVWAAYRWTPPSVAFAIYALDEAVFGPRVGGYVGFGGGAESFGGGGLMVPLIGAI